MATELFKNVYLFKDLNAAELEKLGAIARVDIYSPGDEIFSQGDQADALFIVKYGSIRIRREGKQDAVEVAQIGTGSHFGELAFVDGEPRSATAEAIEKSEVIRIPFAELKAFFETNPTVAVKFYHSLAHFLCGRLRVTTMDLSFAREKNLRHF